MIGLGLVLATIVAFVLSFVFYAVLPADASQSPAAQDRPKPWQVAVELLRSLVVASMTAGLMSVAEWTGSGHGALLGLALWPLPVVLLAGSITWEHVPVRAAAGHAADWLIKLVAIGAIVGFFA